MKKADLSIQYTFLIFMGVIAIFVIIGLLTGWALDADKMMCKLTGECNKGTNLIDKKTIETDQTRFENEIAKHAKLCYDSAKKGEVEGELCYTIKCITPDTCSSSCPNPNIEDPIKRSIGEVYDCSEFTDSNKAIIEFDYSKQKVIIK